MKRASYSTSVPQYRYPNAVGNISGADLNPAVTIGFYAAGRLDFKQVVPYIAAQIAGALSAGLILRFLFPEHAPIVR